MSEASHPYKSAGRTNDVDISGGVNKHLSTPAVDYSLRNQQLIGFIERTALGDEGALAALYDATNRYLYALALRILGEAESAEEVLLDVYKQVWRKASTYSRARGTPLGWLMTIARSRAIDRLRSERQERRRHETLETAAGLASSAYAEEEAGLFEMRKLVRSALDGLPPEQREVIDLAYYDGLTQTEIATKTGQPLGTVKTRARLAMMKLKLVLKPVFEEIR